MACPYLPRLLTNQWHSKTDPTQGLMARQHRLSRKQLTAQGFSCSVLPLICMSCSDKRRLSCSTQPCFTTALSAYKPFIHQRYSQSRLQCVTVCEHLESEHAFSFSILGQDEATRLICNCLGETKFTHLPHSQQWLSHSPLTPCKKKL